MRIRLYFSTVLLTASITSNALAATSQEYVQMGLAVWSAFGCSAIAGVADNSKEQDRLFKYGYEKGKTFIKAIQDKKVKQNDIKTDLPFIMQLLLQGPSADFMLGRVYETSIEYSLEDILKTDGVVNNDLDHQKLLSKVKYQNKNCHLIGR